VGFKNGDIVLAIDGLAIEKLYDSMESYLDAGNYPTGISQTLRERRISIRTPRKRLFHNHLQEPRDWKNWK
jgi:hypothetical protein